MDLQLKKTDEELKEALYKCGVDDLFEYVSLRIQAWHTKKMGDQIKIMCDPSKFEEEQKEGLVSALKDAGYVVVLDSNSVFVRLRTEEDDIADQAAAEEAARAEAEAAAVEEEAAAAVEEEVVVAE